MYIYGSISFSIPPFHSIFQSSDPKFCVVMVVFEGLKSTPMRFKFQINTSYPHSQLHAVATHIHKIYLYSFPSPAFSISGSAPDTCTCCSIPSVASVTDTDETTSSVGAVSIVIAWAFHFTLIYVFRENLDRMLIVTTITNSTSEGMPSSPVPLLP